MAQKIQSHAHGMQQGGYYRLFVDQLGGNQIHIIKLEDLEVPLFSRLFPHFNFLLENTAEREEKVIDAERARPR